MTSRMINTRFMAMSRGVRDSGDAKKGYKLFSKRPTPISKKILKPTHITIFFANSIGPGFSIKNINKPGIMEKNKRLRTGFSTGKSRVMDRSVKRSINSSRARKLLTLSLLKSNIFLFTYEWRVLILFPYIFQIRYSGYRTGNIYEVLRALKNSLILGFI